MFDSLGLPDDGEDDDIVDDVFIMSPVRPYHGEITWSPLSRSVIKPLLETKLCLQDDQNMSTRKQYVHKKTDNQSIVQIISQRHRCKRRIYHVA